MDSLIMGYELFIVNEGDNFIWICLLLVMVKFVFFYLVIFSYVMFYELFILGEWGDFILMVFFLFVIENSL